MSKSLTDRNLLFAVIALQDAFIDVQQLAEIGAVWALDIKVPISELMRKRRWLTDSDCREIEKTIDRKIKKNGGDIHSALAASADGKVRNSLLIIDEPEVRNSIRSLPPTSEYIQTETVIPPASKDYTERYSHLGEWMKGGIGQVIKAFDNSMQRVVALKEMLPKTAANHAAWNSFYKEAQITGQLEHPSIVPVYDLARRDVDDQPFYTMRFIDGATLHDTIRRFHEERKRGPLDRVQLAQELLTPFLKVCDAIGYAHSRGVIHRDLKPANIVLGAYGEAIVLDWGLAKIVNQPKTDEEIHDRSMKIGPEAETPRTRESRGTPNYMAPEQIQNEHNLIDAKTDVYALGAILFEIVTGQLAIKGTPKHEVYKRVLNFPTPKTRDVDPLSPLPLQAICQKAMSKDRSKRYASAKDLGRDVNQWILDEPVSAWKEPLGTRVRRWVGRHQTLVNSLASLVVTAVVALAIATGFINAARDKAENALLREQKANQEANRQTILAENARDEANKQATLAETARREQEKEADHARTEARTANALVTTFLNTFIATDPIGLDGLGIRSGGEAGRNLTAKEILDRNAQEIEKSLADQPNVRATLMDTLGDVYRGMREYEKAESLISKGLKIRTETNGRRSNEVATSLTHLAWLHQDLGHLEQSEKLFQEAYATRELLNGENDKDTLLSKRHLAIIWMIKGRKKKCELAFRELIPKLTKEFGPDHREVGITELGLAASLFDSGKNVEGFIHSRIGLNTMLRNAEKEQSEKVFEAVAKFQLGFVKKSIGLLADAERAYLEGKLSLESMLGKDHPYLAFFYFELGDIAERRPDLKQAECNYKKAFDLAREAVGVGYPKTAEPLQAYCRILLQTNRQEEAIQLISDLIKARADHHGTQSVQYADALFRAVDVLKDVVFPTNTEKLLRQEILLRQALAIYRIPSDENDDPDRLFYVMRMLADVLLNNQKPQEAEPLYRELLAASRERAGADKTDVALIMKCVALSRMRQGIDDQETQNMLRDTIQILSGNNRSFPVDLFEATFFLAQSEFRAKRYGDAEKHGYEALKTSRKLYANVPTLISFHAKLFADIIAAQGDYARSIPYFDEALINLRKAGEGDRVQIPLYMNFAAMVRRGAGRDKEQIAAARELVREFGSGRDFDALFQAAWGAVRFSGIGLDPVYAESLGSRILSARPNEIWYRMVASACYLRAGQFSRTVEILEESRQRLKPAWGFQDVLLATAYHRLDQEVKAKEALDRALAWSASPEYKTSSWDVQLQLRLMIDDARSVLFDSESRLPIDMFAP